MGSTSERQVGAERLRAGYHVWALAVLLCPLSYVSLVLLGYWPATGLIATILVTLFVLTFALTTRDGRTEAKIWQGALLAVAAGSVVGSLARSYEGADPVSATFAGLAAGGQLALFCIFYTWITAELAGVEMEAGDISPTPRRAVKSSRAALGLLLFLSFLLYGLGAAWSRGEARAPNPALWMAVQLVLTLGVMVLERLGFFERSAREGNLAFTASAHRTWIAGAVVVALVASALAVMGPRREPTPKGESRPGNISTEGAGGESGSFPMEQQLRDAGAAVSVAAAGMRSAPRSVAVLWLLLLLLLVALIVVWGFQRSRAARWLLWAVSAVLTWVMRQWQRLRAALARLRRVHLLDKQERTEEAPWVRDPLVDIFEHPELLETLSAREVLIRTYHLLLNYGEMLGLGRGREQTPLEYSRSLGLEGSAGEALGELTWGYAGAMYGGAGTSLPEREAVRSAWGQVAAALRGRYPAEEVARRRAAYAAARA